MPGTYVFKPLEADLTHNTDLIGKMNPYCSLSVGNTRYKGQVCSKGGRHPTWFDTITVPIFQNESKAVIEVMDKDRFSRDDSIGSCVIDLREVQATGQSSKWYPLYFKDRPAGKILLETIYNPTGSSNLLNQSGSLYQQQQQSGMLMTGYSQQQIGMTSTGYNQQSMIKTGLSQQETLSSRSEVQQPHMYVEQRQVVQPHTFKKQVEVVETVPVTKEVQVLEPHTVIKNVPFTKIVPVKKQYEVIEPQVVMKEVEVMEPVIVTKTIQVIEHVPVKKMVEVIEPRTTIQEVETFEPQTFTKQVEVTEAVPIKKQVQITQPVKVQKELDFVEPIITTQTITKAMQEARVVDEKITTSVGPATIVHLETEVGERRMMDQFSQIKISEQQNILSQERLLQQNILGQERLLGQSIITESVVLTEKEFEKEMELIRRHLGSQMWISSIPQTTQTTVLQGSKTESYSNTYQSGLTKY